MTRVVGTADLHVGASHLTTLDDQEGALVHVVDEVLDRKADLLLIAGDVFHVDRPTPAAIAVAGRFFGRLAEKGIDVIVSRGNHDPRASEIVSFFRGNVHVPETPGVIRHHSGVDVAVFPWLIEQHVRAAGAGALPKEEVAAQLSFAARSIIAGFRAQMRPGTPMVVVGHATIAGSETPTGWNMGWVPGTHWVIPSEDFDLFEASLFGHVHKRQPIGRVEIPGSLLPLDFSETEERGILVADIVAGEAAEWEFVRVPTPTVATWDWDDAAVRAQVSMPAVFNGPPVDLLRVRVHCSEETAREFPPARIEAQLLRAGVRKVQVELEVEHPDRARDADMTSELLPLTALGRYVDGREDLDAIAKARVVGAGTIVAGEVQEKQRAASGGDVELVELEARDFIGVREARVTFDGDRVVVLTGRNGSGKSSLGVDVLRHTLTGASRAGARPDVRLVRAGADTASTAVTLRLANGRTVKVVRKLKRERGDRVSSTLDVLEHDDHAGILEELHPGSQWQPLSTGKVADGQRVIDELLGGLDDETLVASSIVVQRFADAFTRARPEERKSLLARAAGLSVYDELGLHSAKHLNEAQRALAELEAQATSLRPRAEAVPRLEAELATAETERDTAAAAVKDLERQYATATEDVERATERATSYERDLGEAKRIHADVAALQVDRAALEHKADVAREMLAKREELERAQADLAAVRSEIQQIQDETSKQREAAAARERERTAAVQKRADLSSRLQQLRGGRTRELAAVGAELTAAERQRDELAASGCLERCAHVEACTVATAATANAERIRELQGRGLVLSVAPDEEITVEAELAAVKVPSPLPVTERTVVLDEKRGRERDLEKAVLVAGKIEAAEAVLKEHDQAIAKVDEQLVAKKKELGEANSRLVFTAGSPVAERDRAAAKQHEVDERLREQRAAAGEGATRAAMFVGRLEELRKAAEELKDVEARTGEAAVTCAAWKELIVAWRETRVSVLETSVIPHIERVANEVLARFPHGLQIALRTQRERKASEGMAETLDVAVLGRGETYEMCSGGERTAIDFATHVALAIVVSRRSTTRLHVLVCDEPEGLDEPSRAAFAGAVRWLAETFDLKCLVMSHAEDLVDALGGTRIDIEATQDVAAADADLVPA